MSTADFLFEAGGLKRVPRSGWLTIGIKDCESVAEHSFRAALAGSILAKMEGVDEGKVVKMLLFHDVHEARLGDVHKVSRKYVSTEEISAAKDAFSKIPFENDYLELFKEFFEGESREAAVARDADLLELIAQAKEYLDLGNKYAVKWIENAKKSLQTESAKKIAKEIEETDSCKWLFEAKEE